jgi:hypothetical protein
MTEQEIYTKATQLIERFGYGRAAGVASTQKLHHRDESRKGIDAGRAFHRAEQINWQKIEININERKNAQVAR